MAGHAGMPYKRWESLLIKPQSCCNIGLCTCVCNCFFQLCPPLAPLFKQSSSSTATMYTQPFVSVLVRSLWKLLKSKFINSTILVCYVCQLEFWYYVTSYVLMRSYLSYHLQQRSLIPIRGRKVIGTFVLGGIFEGASFSLCRSFKWTQRHQQRDLQRDLQKRLLPFMLLSYVLPVNSRWKN